MGRFPGPGIVCCSASRSWLVVFCSREVVQVDAGMACTGLPHRGFGHPHSSSAECHHLCWALARWVRSAVCNCRTSVSEHQHHGHRRRHHQKYNLHQPGHTQVNDDDINHDSHSHRSHRPHFHRKRHQHRRFITSVTIIIMIIIDIIVIVIVLIITVSVT